MEYEKIIDLIHEIESSSITDFALQKGEFRISIKKEGTKEPKAEDDRTIDIEERGNRKRGTGCPDRRGHDDKVPAGRSLPCSQNTGW